MLSVLGICLLGFMQLQAAITALFLLSLLTIWKHMQQKFCIGVRCLSSCTPQQIRKQAMQACASSKAVLHNSGRVFPYMMYKHCLTTWLAGWYNRFMEGTESVQLQDFTCTRKNINACTPCLSRRTARPRLMLTVTKHAETG